MSGTQTVITAEALDALPIGSVVVDRMGDAWLRDHAHDSWIAAETAPCATSRLLRYGPFRVIYRPEVTH